MKPVAESILLKGEMDKENTLDDPNTTVPKASQVNLSGNNLDVKVAAQSFNVYVISL